MDLQILTYLIIEDLVSKGQTIDLSPSAIVGYGQHLCSYRQLMPCRTQLHGGMAIISENIQHQCQNREAEDLRQNEVNIENVKAHDVSIKCQR